MFRMALVACVALVSVVPAAPVPKSLKAKPIRMTAPRPLMIRTAVIEDGVMKLTRDEDDREPQTASLSDVTATDSRGKPLAEATLKKRLAKPTVVAVVPCPLPKRFATALGEEDTEPADVDTGDEWRKVLSAEAVVIDGEAFGLNWEYGRYDMQLVPAEVEDDNRVAIYSLGCLVLHRRWYVSESLILSGEDAQAAKTFSANVRGSGVVLFHRANDLPKEHRQLFRDYVPSAHDDGTRTIKGGRIRGGII